MNIAIYARVSSETQAKEGTIESQIEALHDYAKSHELAIVHEFIDDGYSGSDLNRPGLDQLRDSIQQGAFEAILVLSPDRLSRKQAHQIILLEEFKKRNIQVLFTTHNISDSPEDQLMLQIQGAISEYERATILDRMRRGRKHSVIKGQVLGNIAPCGYAFIPKSDSIPAHWEANAEEAQTVQLILDMYVNKGMKGTTIAKQLQQDGIPTRGPHNKWYSSNIYSILKNEAYAGTAYMFKARRVEATKNLRVNKYRRKKNSRKQSRPREEWIGIPVTPILEMQLWQKAQELLKQNAYRSRRNNNKHQYLLRGLVQCGLCGSAAPGYVSNRNTYCSCGAKRNGNITTKPHDENVAIRHSFLDEKVWSGLVELLDDPNNLKSQLEKRLEG
jgi:site-specific DNA recombinase